MIIKVCGMRDAGNIREVAALGIDLMGFIFYPKSPRYVQMISSQAGILPDYSEERLQQVQGAGADGQHQASRVQRVGVFVDDMPQTIVSCVYNYALDYVQLHGHEQPVMIENLKRTLVPDIAPNIRIIKVISVSTAEDVRQYKAYEGLADLFLFDTKCEELGGSGRQFGWDVLQAYDGQTPFLLSGGIGPDDVAQVKAFHHPQFAGIDLNSRFETAPAMKDVDALRQFIAAVRA
jgi:phosphoribosylanthranilate isomerase